MRRLTTWLVVRIAAIVLISLNGCGKEEQDAPEQAEPELQVVKQMEEDSDKTDTSDARAAGTISGDLIKRPIKVVKINDFIYMATGLANTYMITTPEGNVIVDTGFMRQSRKQAKLLKEINDAPVTHILIPQAQQDDIGGIKLWKGPETKVMMTRTTYEYMSWRKKIDGYLVRRFLVLYNWSVHLLKLRKLLFSYNPIEPEIVVEDREGYRFEVGGIRFEVMALPGAEGDNSAGLWLPDHKILLAGGGFVGPIFPMWPNIGTVRADKDRSMENYIESLNKVIALEPEVLLMGQERPFFGKEKILENLTKIRDAVVYVHNEVVKGLNDGKDVWQLMQEIKLPDKLADLSQGHGRIDWSIRDMVYQYGGWFQYRYTSELYPIHVSDVYPDVVELAGGVDGLVTRARHHLDNDKPVHALHLIEMAVASNPKNPSVLKTQIDILNSLLNNSRSTINNFSEIAWLETEIAKAKGKLH